MRTAILFILSGLILLTIPNKVLCQDEIVYHHPTLDIQFKASPNWTQVIDSNARMSYELVNKNNNMHMLLWFSETREPTIEYLREEVCQEGIVSDDGPFLTFIDDHKAYGICAVCTEMRRPFKVMLIALPVEEGMYMIKFKCPEECFPEHEAQIKKLLSTISFGQVAERTVFYARY